MKSFNFFSNHVKTLPVLLAFLTVFTGGVWGETATITFSSAGSSDSNTAYSTSNFVSDGISSSSSAFGTISCSATSRCYKGKSGSGIKAGASSNAGNFTISFSTPLANVSQITLYRAAYNSSKPATITVKNGSTTLGSESTGSSTSFSDMSITGLSISSLAGITVEANKYCYIQSITITYSPGGGCDKKVTVNKAASTAHGSFSIDKSGEQATCSGLVVTLSGITPDAGYQFSGITQSGVASGVTINNEAKTVTYAANSTGTSEINVTFTALPKYTVTFNAGTGSCGTSSLTEASAGAGVTLPAATHSCDGWTFAGWAAASVGTETTDAPTLYAASSNYKPSENTTLYAVYKETRGGGGGSSKTYTLELDGNNFVSSYNERTSSATANEDGGTGSYTVNFTSSGVMKSSNAGNPIQFRKSGSGAGVLYNTNDLGTINSITYGDGSTNNIASTYKGSTEQPTSAGTGGYFKITNGASVSYITSITINFTKTSGGSGTTYYHSSPSCVPCDNKITLAKGSEENGSFTLNKADGIYDNCATSGLVVNVTNITPASGYQFKEIQQTGVASAIVDNNAKTVTYPQNTNGSSTITVVFELIPTYTVTWSANGDESNTEQYYEGDDIVFPATATGCDGKVFRGWSAVPVPETNVEPSYVTAAVMGTSPITYYAVYAEASGGGSTTWSKASSIAVGDKVVFVSETASTELTSISSTSTKYGIGSDYTTTPAATFVFDVVEGASTGKFAFKNGTNYLYWGSGNSLNVNATLNANTSWSISIASGGNATILNASDDSRQLLWNSGSPRFACYAGQTIGSTYYAVQIYKQAGGTTYSGYTTTCGAGISATDVGWITATKGQKVKRVVNVSAKNFDDPTTLSVSCANSHFNVSLAATDVPAGAAGLATTLTVEYTPADFGAREENVDIVLTAGDKTRTIKVSGRSLPEDFLMIVKKNDKWYALPANMTGGPGEYAGIEVAPNDNTTPTVVPVSPSTAIYHLASNAADRYETAGQCVRLVGMGELCLWSNMAEGATKVNIQNKISVSSASGVNYDWLLTTTDGIHYTVANPNHPLYASGRILSYGTKFGMYVEDAVFFFVSAGCTSQPDNVLVSPHRVDATFSWMCTAPSVTIDIYTNEAMTEGHLSATVSSAPYIFTGLAETTDYWFKLTPGTDTDCAVTGSFKTTGPSIDIVEWQQEAVILHIDKGDITPVIVIDGQEEHGSITGGGGTATELFFAKYFEGSGDMKLLSVFNGTNDAINLANYSIYIRCRGTGDGWAPTSDVTLELSSLGTITAGQEIIFFTRPDGGDLGACSDGFLDDKVTNHSSAESNPRWVECSGDPFKKITFNGNDPVMLKKNGTIIDIIGSQGAAATTKNCLTANNEKGWLGTVRNMDYGKTVDDPSFDAFYAASSKHPSTTAAKKELLEAFGINLDDEEISLTTARCIFFRDKRVTSGDSAVLMNETTGTTFVTFTNHDSFKSEWYGRSVCMNDDDKTAAGVSSDAQATCNSYQDIANMDYNEYYIDYTSHIEEGKTLDEFTSDPETKEYTIPIPDLVNYTCLNIRFQLKQGGNVVTEVAQQVPIMVDGSKTTSDALFSELVVDQSTHLPSYSHSVERCKTCDVVILGTGTLTKAADSDAKDVPEVGNVKVYPGGKLVVPSTTTNYTVKSLAFRRQEDAVSTANIEGNLTIGTTDAVYLDMRIDPTNWHYFTLPYDCKVEDIRFANPNETAVPTLGTDFLLKWYNGDKRAATQSTGCWEMVSPSATLKKGIGYIFALPGEGKERQEFRFPMSNDVVTEEKDTYKDAMGIYAYGGDKSMTEVRANHRGWNLIGNPYLLPYTSDITSPVMTGLIVEDHSEDDPQWNGHYTFDPAPATNLRYIVEPIANGWAGYEQVALSDYSMKPFTAYFVQVGGADPSDPQGVRFNLSRVNRSSIVARQAAEYEEDTHPVWCAVDLTNSKGEKDETTLLISDDFTDEYDMMDDLVKMRGTYYQYAQITTKPVLASRNNEGEMAFNALPDLSAKAGVPLHYFTAYGGEYTISYNNKYDRNNEVTEVKLLDTKTNEWYDLMAQAYTFTTNREDNKNRFYLSVGVERYNAPQVTTGCMQVRRDDTGGPRKILIDGHVYIQRGGAIYDITGKQMLNK